MSQQGAGCTSGGRVVCHPGLREAALALRSAGRAGVARVHVFEIPARLVQGIYSLAFVAPGGWIHRCVVSYHQRARLRDELRDLGRALQELQVPQVTGRVEVGRNTGGVLRYFLPNVGEEVAPAEAERRRDEVHRAWLAAVREDFTGAFRLRRIPGGADGPVACASRGDDHYLLRLDPQGQRSLEESRRQLGGVPVGRLGRWSRLYRDVMGAWRT